MSTIRQPTMSDLLLVVLLGTLWGSAFAAIKIAVEEIGPVLVVVGRIVTAFALVWAWLLWKGFVLPRTKQQWTMLIIMGLLNTVIPFYLIAWAEQHLASSITALIMGFGPLMALFISHFTTRDDRFTVFKFAGVALGFCAVVTVIGVEVIEGGKSELIPAVAIFLANLCYVISGAMIRHVPDTTAETMAGITLLVAVIAMVPLITVANIPPISSVSIHAIGAVLYLGAIATALSYFLRFHLATTVGYSYMTLAAYVMPVAGVIFGAVLLAEPISSAILIALVLIICGLLVARIRR